MSERPTASGIARRHWLAIGLASIGAGAGASFAWRKLAGDPPYAAASQAFWDMSFDQPDGGQLQVAQFRGKPLLLNFWATWCPPCLKEMPLLDSFHRERGWQVVGLAVDQSAPVRAYLQRLPIGFPIALAGLEGVKLSRELGNAGGQLPYTVVFDSNSQLADKHLGAVDEARLNNWFRDVR